MAASRPYPALYLNGYLMFGQGVVKSPPTCRVELELFYAGFSEIGLDNGGKQVS